MKLLLLVALIAFSYAERASNMDEPYWQGEDEPADDDEDSIAEPGSPNSEWDTGKRETNQGYPNFESLQECYKRKSRTCTVGGDCVLSQCYGSTQRNVSQI